MIYHGVAKAAFGISNVIKNDYQVPLKLTLDVCVAGKILCAGTKKWVGASTRPPTPQELIVNQLGSCSSSFSATPSAKNVGAHWPTNSPQRSD